MVVKYFDVIDTLNNVHYYTASSDIFIKNEAC